MSAEPSPQQKKPMPNRRAFKIYKVALGQMRVPQALVTQREFRPAHGDTIAAELDLDKIGLLILNHRNGIYWVLDGQHRLYALRKWFNDEDKIECEVYEDLSDAEMAEMFLGRDKRRQISTFDKFHVACTAGRTRENDIRRLVEANKLRVGRVKEDNTIGAVSALGKVYDRSGDVVLGQVLRTLRDGFAGDPAAFSPHLIEGTGLVFNRYNGRTNEKVLVARLSQAAHGHRGILQRAQTLRLRTRNRVVQCVAAAIVELYNRGRSSAKDKLPDWWRGNEGPAGQD